MALSEAKQPFQLSDSITSSARDPSFDELTPTLSTGTQRGQLQSKSCDIMFSKASVAIHGGVFNSISQTNDTSRGMDILTNCIATGAFHDSDELYDAPKCHPHTRVAVLDDIMQWVTESESGREDLILWLFGPAGAGKSAIGKKIAEIAADKGLLIATFFFSRTSSTGRNTKDRLVATLAYQLALSIPDTRTHIQDAIERDPAIFKKNLQSQINTLLIKPFQIVSSTSNHIIPLPKLIVIDGLDECNDSRAQVAILDVISCSLSKHNLPIIFLVTSRPELDIVTSFNSNEPLKSIHRRVALDDTYRPDDDIRLFFSDKLEHIRLTHHMRSSIPTCWPTQEVLDMLVKKSSGQFIFAATVVKFVESNQHRPPARLDIILGISPASKMNPFAELDALYIHILSCVDDIQLTLRVLSLYVAAPGFASHLRESVTISAELFLSVEQGDIGLTLINLSSIVSFEESSGAVKFLHTSFVDFLSDKRRSTVFYIDMASTHTDFARRILQYVKGPDGIRAGDTYLFYGVLFLRPWIFTSQLRSDILNFDFDTFIKAVIRHRYKEPIFGRSTIQTPVVCLFHLWRDIYISAGLEDGDKQENLDRCSKYLELQAEKYKSDWRLQLLFILAAVGLLDEVPRLSEVPDCRRVDILLEMDDHDLHLVDQDALDLRHAYLAYRASPEMIYIMTPYVDGDKYASAALHCMRFLSNPPKIYEKHNSPNAGLIYAEWKATCTMALGKLHALLKRASTSPELVQFISNHDIHPEARKKFSVEDIWRLDADILAFLSRANVCVNWRIISAIRRALGITDHPPSEFGMILQEEETVRVLMGREDQCCLEGHPKVGKFEISVCVVWKDVPKSENSK